jgi:hypothetical protein
MNFNLGSSLDNYTVGNAPQFPTGRGLKGDVGGQLLR